MRFYDRGPRKGRVFLYIVIVLIAAIAGGVLSAYIAPNYLYGKVLPMPEMYKNESTQGQEDINIIPEEEITPVESVAKKAISSVVGITSIQIQEEIFSQEEIPGVGSGVIIDSNGYILTNAHVIADGQAKEINVLYENGDMSQAEVLWSDKALDLAIIKTEDTGLPVAEFGDSDVLNVGELAVAIGNPLGLDFQRTVTAGIISGLNRSIRMNDNMLMEDLIQTDASINFGNSGGPLLNNEGQVIGINTAKVKSGEGLSFAIPINIIKPIAEEVIREGSFSNVYIGFEGWEVAMHERYTDTELGVDSGVVVLDVIPRSPARRANLRALDVVYKIDGEEIETMQQLRKILYGYRIGDTATLTIIRQGEEQEVEITFTEF